MEYKFTGFVSLTDPETGDTLYVSGTTYPSTITVVAQNESEAYEMALDLLCSPPNGTYFGVSWTSAEAILYNGRVA